MIWKASAATTAIDSTASSAAIAAIDSTASVSSATSIVAIDSTASAPVLSTAIAATVSSTSTTPVSSASTVSSPRTKLLAQYQPDLSFIQVQRKRKYFMYWNEPSSEGVRLLQYTDFKDCPLLHYFQEIGLYWFNPQKGLY